MKHHTVICLPNIHSMICGVGRITLAGSKVTLHYTDGTSESAEILPRIQQELLKPESSPFSLVSAVQSIARSETMKLSRLEASLAK